MMIRRLFVFDFDGTLYDSELPESGKVKWEKITGEKYPHLGWWGRPESLDVNVFNNKPFPRILQVLNNAKNEPDSYVMILTSRLERLRPYLEKVLEVNNINVDEVSMKRDDRNKGQKVLEMIHKLPEIQQISVFDDRDVDINDYKSILHDIPKKIIFNIYLANNGDFELVDSNSKINKFIAEEVLKTKK